VHDRGEAREAADLRGPRRGELGHTRLEVVDHLHQHRRALGRRGGRPRAVVERCARRGDRAVHVVGAGLGDAGDHLLGVRVDDLELVAEVGATHSPPM
jgi:hypothetical protein